MGARRCSIEFANSWLSVQRPSRESAHGTPPPVTVCRTSPCPPYWWHNSRTVWAVRAEAVVTPTQRNKYESLPAAPSAHQSPARVARVGGRKSVHCPDHYAGGCVCGGATAAAPGRTLLISPSKNRALATTVSNASVLTRVRDVSDEPGSLNAMCPSVGQSAVATRVSHRIAWRSTWPVISAHVAVRASVRVGVRVRACVRACVRWPCVRACVRLSARLCARVRARVSVRDCARACECARV